MRSLTCPGCGHEFTAYAARQKFCSDGCKADARRARGRAHWAANKESPKAFCSFEGGCDKPVVAHDLCSGHAAQRQKGQPLRPLRWTRGEGPAKKPKGPQDRNCENCGEPFTAVGRGSGRKKYCTETCAQDAKRAGAREYQQTHRLLRPPCEFDGCVNPMASFPLCAGHKAQQKAGKPLTPIGLRGQRVVPPPKTKPGRERAKVRSSKRLKGFGGQQQVLKFPASHPRGTPCPFEGCGRPIYSRGLCTGHYSQAINGRDLTPLKPQRRWYAEKEVCAFPQCENLEHSVTLCLRHDSQRRKTSVGVADYLSFAEWLDDTCSYCTESLAGKFEIDHAHDGDCSTPHRDHHMCPDCIRGFVHRQCNEELKWLERAIRAGRIVRPAPVVARYLAVRPFLEQARR